MAKEDIPNTERLLSEIAASLRTLQQEHAQLANVVDGIQGKVNVLAQVKEVTKHSHAVKSDQVHPKPAIPSPFAPPEPVDRHTPSPSALSNAGARRSSLPSKITLTSYPGQAGVDAIPLHWGSSDPSVRGPVVVSRGPGTIGRRNGMEMDSRGFQTRRQKRDYLKTTLIILQPSALMEVLIPLTMRWPWLARMLVLTTSQISQTRSQPHL